MHPGILQQRDREAQQRIFDAARQLAAGANLEPLIAKAEGIWHRDRALADMFLREALAEILEAVVATRAAPDPGERKGTQTQGNRRKETVRHG